jgi:hypothetical protein
MSAPRFKVGDIVSVTFGLDMRVTGKIIRGPYPDEASAEFQRREFGGRCRNFYDVLCGKRVLQAAATHVRKVK